MANSNRHKFLADLIDDLTVEQLSLMLNDFAIMGHPVSRANIRGWRARNGLQLTQNEIDSGKNAHRQTNNTIS